MLGSQRSATAKRKQYILDKWQLSVSTGVVGAALATGLLFMLASYALTAQDPIARLSGREIGTLAVLANAVYFLFLLGVLVFLTVRVTHSVAGPAMIIERAVRALQDGKFDSRLSLRRRDYLKGLAGAVQSLTGQMQQELAELQSLADDLEDALERKDHAAARELTGRLRELASVPRPSETSQERAVA